MDVNFELYKVFYHVAKALSFSEASAELYISQSAVSQSIRQLERKLNSRLFVRNAKQVRMTQEGEILFRHVEQAFHFLKAGERSVSEIQSLQRGEIRIAASDTICKYYLLPYFKQFNRLYPRIRIHVTNRTSPMCMELVMKGMADVGVVNLPPDRGKYQQLTMTTLALVHDVFIAGPGFEELRGRELDIRDLERYPLLMLEKNSISRECFDRFVRDNGAEIAPEIELGSVDLLVELARIGLGVAFVPGEFFSEDIAAGKVFPLRIRQEIPARELGLVTYSPLPVPAAARKFIALWTGGEEQEVQEEQEEKAKEEKGEEEKRKLPGEQ